MKNNGIFSPKIKKNKKKDIVSFGTSFFQLLVWVGRYLQERDHDSSYRTVTLNRVDRYL